MHPATLEFGLKYNMFQLRGDDVVLSDRLLEYMSRAAFRQLHGKRIDGSELLDDVITRGVRKMPLDYARGKHGEIRAFFAKLDGVVWNTMVLYAERAGIGYRTGRTFYFTRAFAGELFRWKKILHPAGDNDIYGPTKVLFLACYDAVHHRCEKVIPEDLRHAELLALCMWQAYDGIIMDNFVERFGG